MMRSVGTGLGYLALLVALGGLDVASAADGGTSTSNARSSSGTSTPTSEPADAPPPHKPPQQAFDACKSLNEGDACSVTFDGHTMNGTCRKGPNGESDLACAPPHPQGPPPSSNGTLSGSALERQLDRLERDIHGA